MPVEPDTYHNSHVFVNKLGITDSQWLHRAEADFSLIRAEQYRNHPLPATFDLEHLKAIHRHLFSDLYEWAGEIRGYDISKGFCRFAEHEEIENHANRLYSDLATEDYLVGLRLKDILPRLAYYYDITNRIHPFPEGNGRTQRLFIEHLAANAGFEVDWSKAQAWQIVEVATQSFAGRLEPTVFMFEEITRVMDRGENWALIP